MTSITKPSGEKPMKILQRLSQLPDLTPLQLEDAGTRKSWSTDFVQTLMLTEDQDIRRPARKVHAIIKHMNDNQGRGKPHFVALEKAYNALRELKSFWVRLQDADLGDQARIALSTAMSAWEEKVHTAAADFRNLLSKEQRSSFDESADRTDTSSQDSLPHLSEDNSNPMNIVETDSEPGETPTGHGAEANNSHKQHVNIMYDTPSPQAASTPATSPATASRLYQKVVSPISPSLEDNRDSESDADLATKEFACSKDDPRLGLVDIRGDESDYDTSDLNSARQRMTVLLRALEFETENTTSTIQNQHNVIVLVHGQVSRMRDRLSDHETLQGCDLDLLLEVSKALMWWIRSQQSSSELNVCIFELVFQAQHYILLALRDPTTISLQKLTISEVGLGIQLQAHETRKHLLQFWEKSRNILTPTVRPPEHAEEDPSRPLMPLSTSGVSHAFSSSPQQARRNGTTADNTSTSHLAPRSPIASAHAPPSELAVILSKIGNDEDS